MKRCKIGQSNEYIQKRNNTVWFARSLIINVNRIKRHTKPNAKREKKAKEETEESKKMKIKKKHVDEIMCSELFACVLAGFSSKWDCLSSRYNVFV